MTNWVLMLSLSMTRSCYDTYLCGGDACLYLAINVTALIDDFLLSVERLRDSLSQEGGRGRRENRCDEELKYRKGGCGESRGKDF